MTYREELEEEASLWRCIKGETPSFQGRTQPLPAELVCELVKQEVNKLIAHLYQPHDRIGWVCNGRMARRLGLHEDAINWGDLACRRVELGPGGVFTIYIEEASPDCQALPRWISEHLAKWGWPSVVITDW